MSTAGACHRPMWAPHKLPGSPGIYFFIAGGIEVERLQGMGQFCQPCSPPKERGNVKLDLGVVCVCVCSDL